MPKRVTSSGAVCQARRIKRRCCRLEHGDTGVNAWGAFCVGTYDCILLLVSQGLSVTNTHVPSLQSTAVSKALGCIAPSLPKAASAYTQALLAYTFALAKDSQRTQELLDILDRKAIRAGTRPSVLGEHQRGDE